MSTNPMPVVPGRLSGLKILVTGAGSGIGLATVLRIVDEGGQVIAADIDAARLQALSDAHPALGIITVCGDVTDVAHVAALKEACAGRLDGLVNNAGVIDGFTPLGDTGDALWQRVMAINVDAPFRLTRALLPLLLESPAASVVNVASVAALRGSACGTAYTTSKHALVGMTRSAAFFYGPRGVRFNLVAPGGVDTNIDVTTLSEWGAARVQEVASAIAPPSATTAQLAAPICWLLSRDSDNVCGTVLAADGGWSAI